MRAAHRLNVGSNRHFSLGESVHLSAFPQQGVQAGVARRPNQLKTCNTGARMRTLVYYCLLLPV
jgi:hypothetical protein